MGGMGRAQEAYDRAEPPSVPATIEDEFDAYLEAHRAGTEREWRSHLEDVAAGRSDPCTREAFDAEVDPPLSFGDWVAERLAELAEDAAEERADRLRDEARGI